MSMLSNGRHLAFPFRIGSDGRAAAPLSDADQVRDEILQLLLTNPGERLFLPDFGGGVRKLVFEPASDVLLSMVKARITNALARWLGQQLTVEFIDVTFDDATALLEVSLKYRPAGSADSRVLKFQRTGP
jgi:phage baseplate assembly protein W